MSGLLERFFAHDRQALARLLTHVENRTDLGHSAIQRLSSHASNAHLVGITGPPGAGKSTLANALVREIRSRGKSVAVLAIDPTSPFSGGAALGDRIRMLESQDDQNVYIRSMASRGQVGGLATAAFGAATVLDAFGFDVVLIETVGTGQDEVEIAALADSVLVIQTPGLGDSVQAIKAGILEIADVLAVNKADLQGADDLLHDLRQMVRLGEKRDWRPPVLPVVASDSTGIAALADELERHLDHLVESGTLVQRRADRSSHHARMLALSAFNDWLAHMHDSGQPDDDPVARSRSLLDEFAKSRLSDGFRSSER